MKALLLLLALFSCSYAPATIQDAGVSNDYAENKAKWVVERYYPRCVELCFKDTYSRGCPNRCIADFKQIMVVMMRALRDGKEDDFDAMMDAWYGY